MPFEMQIVSAAVVAVAAGAATGWALRRRVAALTTRTMRWWRPERGLAVAVILTAATLTVVGLSSASMADARLRAAAQQEAASKNNLQQAARLLEQAEAIHASKNRTWRQWAAAWIW